MQLKSTLVLEEKEIQYEFLSLSFCVEKVFLIQLAIAASDQQNVHIARMEIVYKANPAYAGNKALEAFSNTIFSIQLLFGSVALSNFRATATQSFR